MEAKGKNAIWEGNDLVQSVVLSNQIDENTFLLTNLKAPTWHQFVKGNLWFRSHFTLLHRAQAPYFRKVRITVWVQVYHACAWYTWSCMRTSTQSEKTLFSGSFSITPLQPHVNDYVMPCMSYMNVMSWGQGRGDIRASAQYGTPGPSVSATLSKCLYFLVAIKSVWLHSASHIFVLTEHVESADGVGLYCFDGVVHVIGGRGWRRQVIDLIHCEEQDKHKSSHLETNTICSSKM